MIILQGFISGLIATILFDIFNISLSYAYGVNKPKWHLLGRYFIGYKQKKFLRKFLEEEEKESHEFLWGYVIHYIIGLIYGIFYVWLNLLFFDYPSLLIAYLFGFITVLGAWCYMMPFAFNLGFFASKSDKQFNILAQNLIAHFIFGTGLFIGYYISF